MKRYGYMWDELVSFRNLLHAAESAQRGKRFRPSVGAFHFQLERELWKLREELLTHTYQPGPYRSFYIHEPKKRLISAAPYRDRVVHHALTTNPEGCLRILQGDSFDPLFGCMKTVLYLQWGT